MRRLVVAFLLLMTLGLATPGHAAEAILMNCHTCDKVNVTGKGLAPNTTFKFAIRDVETGQQLTPVPGVSVRSDANGGFQLAVPVDMTKHAHVDGTLYDTRGSVLVLAAHNRLTSPAMCMEMMKHLPFTGPRHFDALLALGAMLLLVGGIVLFLARARPRRA